jgi:hypothetical protein
MGAETWTSHTGLFTRHLNLESRGWRSKMIGQTILMLAAFFLGCILTEIRWIGRMRRLRGLHGLTEAARMYGGEGATLVAAADAGVDAGVQGRLSHDEAQESLHSLQQQLTDEAQASPVPETATRSKT